MNHKLKENIHIDVENFLHILQVLTLEEKCQYFKTWTSNYWIPSANISHWVRFLGKGDFCGEEVFDRVLINRAALSNFTLPTETVNAQTEVEVWGSKLQRVQQLKTLRPHSSLNTIFSVEQWNPKAAYALLAAWPRHKNKG
ncbi:unnamed protein product [Malus baccata var. baccata]